MPPTLCLSISRSACLSIIASAAEVFPKECMGSICCDLKANCIHTAFPYQVAKRKTEEVQSDSSGVFDKLFKSGPYIKLGDYHSHPYVSTEKMETLRPSPTDLEELDQDTVEVIVQVRRTRRKSNYWRTTKSERVSIAWDRYRFLIAGFMRVEGVDDEGVPLYKKVGLKMID